MLLAKRKPMNRQSVAFRVLRADALKPRAVLGWFKTYNERLVSVFDSFTREAARINFRPGAPIGEERVNDENDAHFKFPVGDNSLAELGAKRRVYLCSRRILRVNACAGAAIFC